MDYTELLFAAEVRKLALEFKKNACPDDVANGSESDLHAWFDATPISNFVPDALKEIEEVAHQIKREKQRV